MMMIMCSDIFDLILSKLEGISYKLIEHNPTLTSADSARERGEDIKIGGKAILLKVDSSFKLFVLSAALKLDSNAIRKEFGIKKIRFATADELLSRTGLVSGSVPPFGDLFNLELYVDESVKNNEKIAFNAGSLTKSIILNTKDYLNVANYNKIFLFSKK